MQARSSTKSLEGNRAKRLTLIPTRYCRGSRRQVARNGAGGGAALTTPPRPWQSPPFQEVPCNVYLYPIHCQSASGCWVRTRAFSPGRAQYCASGTCQVAEAQFCALARFRLVIHPGPHGESRDADGPSTSVEMRRADTQRFVLLPRMAVRFLQGSNGPTTDGDA
jgi:hypothetical protein